MTKRWGVKDEKLQYFGGSWKNPGLIGGFTERGAWTVCKFKGGGERGGGVFERGVDTLMHTMVDFLNSCIYVQTQKYS